MPCRCYSKISVVVVMMTTTTVEESTPRSTNVACFLLLRAGHEAHLLFKGKDVVQTVVDYSVFFLFVCCFSIKFLTESAVLH
jgi:hypothetical protein